MIRPAIWPDPPEPYPEDSIGSPQARFRLGTREHLELVAQYQVLEDKLAAGATSINRDAREQIEEAQHRRGRISAGRRPKLTPAELGVGIRKRDRAE
jgi:hypothetical protein